MTTPLGQKNIPRRVGRFLLDVSRGMLMGVAEVLPGISGGTVALIVGIYERIVFSASEAVRGFVLLFSFSKNRWVEAGARLRSIEWSLLIPLLTGMVFAIVVSSALVVPLIETYPTLTSAAFAGLILASIVIPIQQSGGKWRLKEFLFASLAAGFAFGFSSIPKSPDGDPSFLLIFGSAALAVCALALPGISGSNLLIAMGMYTPVLIAVNTLDWEYLGIFMLGAIVGFGSFVGILQWLFENYRRMTLVVMTGLMVGSLRALWPWQTEQGALAPIATNPLPELVALAVGLVVVALLVKVERRFASE